jgi:hypothetical protein
MSKQRYLGEDGARVLREHLTLQCTIQGATVARVTGEQVPMPALSDGSDIMGDVITLEAHQAALNAKLGTLPEHRVASPAASAKPMPIALRPGNITSAILAANGVATIEDLNQKAANRRRQPVAQYAPPKEKYTGATAKVLEFHGVDSLEALDAKKAREATA